MATKAEVTIQGLNIIPTDVLSDELISPMSDDINRDLEAQLAMWTNFQFPNSSTIRSSSSSNPNHNADADDENELIFSPERDTASKSRHKAIPVEDFTSGHFFGNVGASLAHPATSSHAKFQPLTPHLHHGNNNHNNHNTNNNTMGDGNNIENDQINELFSFFPPGDTNLNSALVDPFLNITPGASGYGHEATSLPPLTVRDPRENGRPHPAFPAHMPQMQMQTIDPATTTLSHRVTLSLSSTTPSRQRQKTKGHGGASHVVIPVDHDYTAPSSAIGDDEMDQDRHDLDDPSNSNGSSNYDDSTPPQLDASGNPIPYSAAEDKRRRNTLASARFRQKKKEREAAMERKARELDDRVATLERECQSLRKENRMLRGLLVDGVPAPNSSTASTSAENGDSSKPLLDDKNLVGVGAGASVVLLEELVRLLKANSAVLNHAPGQVAPTPPNGRTATTTGKRKRGAGN